MTQKDLDELEKKETKRMVMILFGVFVGGLCLVACASSAAIAMLKKDDKAMAESEHLHESHHTHHSHNSGGGSPEKSAPLLASQELDTAHGLSVNSAGAASARSGASKRSGVSNISM